MSQNTTTNTGIILNNFDSVYLDFDGTITKTDTVNAFFKKFALPQWTDIESDWVNGKIDSKTCMQMQLDLIKNLTEEKLYNFLDSIEIQDGFREFCALMIQNNKKITILSDGFDFFISHILKKEGLEYIPLYSNHLEIFKKNISLTFKLTFPNKDKNCSLSLGTCKCSYVQKDIQAGKNFIYAGDGLSDRCIASKSIMLFAKNSLKKHCIENNIRFTEFENFFQISECLLQERDAINAKIGTKNTI